jgi:hypothetical protein
MLIRKLFVGCLALVLIARAVHCLHVDAMLCAGVIKAALESPPLSDPSETDLNESGCLCKGAISVESCPVADPRLSGASYALIEAPSPASRLVVEPQPRFAADFAVPAPFSAGKLRALHASWQI